MTDLLACAVDGHYVSTACIDAHRLTQPDLHAACRRTCKFCGAACACTTCTHTGDPAPTYGALLDRLREEQTGLWSDLHHAVLYAQVDQPVIPGHWSTRCDEVASRIAENAVLVGPVSWKYVQVDLLVRGIYEKVLRAAGLVPPPIDWDAVRDLYARVKAPLTWGGPPVDLTDVHPDWSPL